MPPSGSPVANIDPTKVAGKHVGLVRAKYNSDITEAMLERAKAVLDSYAVTYDVFEVMGSFELIYALTNLADTGTYDGLVPIGCLIKGETMHFEYIANSLSQAIVELTTKHNLPITFGVLTCLTRNQAETRLALAEEATNALLELLSTF